jgi:hypothetical protein
MDGDPEGLEQVGEGEHLAPIDASDRLSFIRHGRFSFSLFGCPRVRRHVSRGRRRERAAL